MANNMDKISNMISICIPTYEMKGKGVEYLEYSFNILYSQTYTDFEIIISDHSTSNEIRDLCDAWSEILNITYIKNEVNKGSSSSNINNALVHAKGDYIKVLFQDDFLYDENSLQNQIDCLKNKNSKWLVAACCHYNEIELYNPFYPKYHDEIQYGRNTISSPSVLMFANENIILFDEKLIWLMDVDYYKRLYNKWGLPVICNDICIVNREHTNQISNTLATTEIKEAELQYIIHKYK
jgi:glycosyltransferase involved in cell wall biosynthesis